MFLLGHGRVAEPMLDLVHLVFEVEERLERTAGFFEHGAAGVRQPVLRQVADCQVGRSDNAAGVGLLVARQHAEQRGFSGAVWSAQADTLAVVDLPGDAIEQDPVAE
jgi:hypothetical protein